MIKILTKKTTRPEDIREMRKLAQIIKMKKNQDTTTSLIGALFYNVKAIK
jgi:hypothetical protein